MDVTCPFCDFDFEAEIWSCGVCPSCGKKYYCEEFCTEDFSDCWPEIVWGI